MQFYVFTQAGNRPSSMLRPPDIEEKAAALIGAGWKFEAEILSTGELFIDCCDSEQELANELCRPRTSPSEAGAAFDRLVLRAHQAWVAGGRWEGV